MWDIIQFLTPPFFACLAMVGILGYFGIHVLEREIIFIDITLAQIAAVGLGLALIFWKVKESSLTAYLFAFGFTVLAALFFSQIRKKITQIPQEAVIGVTYAIAAAAALFFLALAPGGDIHLEHMLTGSILWAKWLDIFISIGVYVAVAIVHIIFRDKFKSISQDYQSALDRGLRAEWWDFLFYVTMGIVIILSVKIAGVLVIFSFLVIPATFAALFAVNWKRRLIVAWIMGLVASLAGILFSYFLDFSTGPSVVSFLGLFIIVAVLLKKLIKPRISSP